MWYHSLLLSLILFLRQFFLILKRNRYPRNIEPLVSFFKTLEKEKRARERVQEHARHVFLCLVQMVGVGVLQWVTLLLLTATNSVKRHLIQPLHTSSRDDPVVRASNLRLCTYFLSGYPLTQFMFIHFLHLDSSYMLVGKQNRLSCELHPRVSAWLTS